MFAVTKSNNEEIHLAYLFVYKIYLMKLIATCEIIKHRCIGDKIKLLIGEHL